MIEKVSDSVKTLMLYPHSLTQPTQGGLVGLHRRHMLVPVNDSKCFRMHPQHLQIHTRPKPQAHAGGGLHAELCKQLVCVRR